MRLAASPGLEACRGGAIGVVLTTWTAGATDFFGAAATAAGAGLLPFGRYSTSPTLRRGGLRSLRAMSAFTLTPVFAAMLLGVSPACTL